MRAGALVLLALGLAGCEPSALTQIVVLVDSDLAVPEGVDTVRVEVTGVEGASAMGMLVSSADLPRTVTLVHRGGPLGPLTVDAVGLRAGVEAVRARARTSFIEGRTLVLPVHLSRRCVGVSCPAGEVCSDGACGSPEVDPATLAEWEGELPASDAGVCVPRPEQCNGMDDDCDGRIDEDFDLSSDPLHCGACNVACSSPNAMTTCRVGRCEIVGCDAGFDDCNEDPADGCEADLASTAHCGACGVACAFSNASAACVGGACELTECEPGFGDCNDDPADGCETSLTSLTDCGGCGLECSIPGGVATCESGACAIGDCEEGLGDCNADPSDGCEQPLDTLEHCGGCSVTCELANATESCASGSCQIVECAEGFGDCNEDPSDGCEQALDTVAHCGACGDACDLANATATCTSGGCEIVSCAMGFGDCNDDPSDGCETPLNTEAHCGSCEIACVSPACCRPNRTCGGGGC